ncbi:MAG: outer membrane protein assembly factor BamB family protein [Pirellulales bacterium]
MKLNPLIFFIVVSTTLSGHADNWPQWRGPNGNSVAENGTYPTEFSKNENVLWKVKLPGLGSSTPIVWGKNIFVTGGDDGSDSVQSYDWEGKLNWKTTFGPERPGKHKNGSGANSSPVTDGKNIYVYFKSGTVASLTLDGKLNWKINLQEKFGEDTLWWDLGTSPILAGGNLVIAVMQEGESYVIALNPGDGSVKWKIDRTFSVQKESGQSYTTPFVCEVDGQETIVIWGADRLSGHHPETGKVLWKCEGFNPEDQAMWRVIASPGITDGIAVIPYGRTKFCAGVKLGGRGDITSTGRLWERNDLGADCPTPVGRDGKMIVLSDKGQLNYLDAQTGKDIWQDAIPRARSKYYSSPILAGNLLYCAREDGVVSVIQISENGMEIISQNDMEEKIAATPVLTNGRILLRGAEHLYCIENRD